MAPDELLLAKIGDEVPDLPAHHGDGGDDRPSSSNPQTSDQPAEAIAAYLALDASDESTLQAAGGDGKAGDMAPPLLVFSPRRFVRQRRGDQPLTAVVPGPIQ